MPMDVNVLKQIFQQRAGMSGGENAQPQAPQGGNSPQPQPSQAPAGTMNEQPLAQVSKSQPGEAQIIIKGLVNRLRQLPPQ